MIAWFCCSLTTAMAQDDESTRRQKLAEKLTWLYNMGVEMEQQGEYGKAVKCYREFVMLEPDDIIYSRLAICYEELNEYESALYCIGKAMELAPEEYDYIYIRADLLYYTGKCKEAVEAYDEFIEKDPDYWGGYYRRGFMKDNLNDVDGAIADYSKAIELNPDLAYSYLGRADKYLLKGDREAAMSDYRMVVALDTIYVENNCAQYAYLALGEVEKAKAFQQEILALSPSAGHYYDAACLYARMGDREASLGYLRKSLEKGFRNFSHIRNDDDLNILRDMQGYKDLMEEYEAKYKEEQKQQKRSLQLFLP